MPIMSILAILLYSYIYSYIANDICPICNPIELSLTSCCRTSGPCQEINRDRLQDESESCATIWSISNVFCQKKSIALYQEMYHRGRITSNFMVGFEKRCTIKWFTWRDTSNYMVALKRFKPHQEIYPRKVRVVVPSVRLRTTALRPLACYIWTDNYRGSSSRRSITGCYMKR